MRALTLSVLAAIAPSLPPRAANAQAARSVRLTVQAPPESGCITAAALGDEVQYRVGSARLIDSPLAERQVQVLVTPRSRGFIAVIRAANARGSALGERSVATEDADCRALDRPLALVVSTLIGIGPDSEPSKRTALLPEPPAPPSASGADAPPPSRAPSIPFDLGLTVTGGARSGLLPGVAPLGAIRLLARRGWLQLRLGVGAVPHGSRDLGGGARATFRGAFGDADLCALTGPGPSHEFAFCAGARAGALTAESSGLFATTAATRGFVEATLQTAFQVLLVKNHGLTVGLGAAIPIVPQTYVFVEQGDRPRTIHAVELGLSGEVGWFWRFGS